MTEKSETKSTAIIRKIRALLAKTVENGCTEEEAMAAAALASKLMGEHDLSQTNLELGATKCEQKPVDLKQRNEAVNMCATAVAYFTDTKVWLHTGRRTQVNEDLFGVSHHVEEFYQIMYFGLPHDVEIAAYLTAICRAAMERGAVDFRAQFGAKTQTGWGHGGNFRFGAKGQGRFDAHHEFEAKLPDFLCGMASSMSAALRDMKRQRDIDTCASSGRDLVAVKSAVVEVDFRQLGLHLGRSRGTRAHDSAAYAAGSAAGQKVRFHEGVSRSGQTKQIGR